METVTTTALLLLDLPDQALAGIDLLSFTTTPRFKGVKNLPPGFHFAFVSSSTAFSERHGIWVHVQDPDPSDSLQLFITKWDVSSETLVAVTDQAEILKWRANLGGIWREGLTPYRQSASVAARDDEDVREELVNWPTLTSHITTPLLSRILHADPCRWTLTSSSSASRDLDEIPGVSNADIGLHTERELALLPINLKQTWRHGATGRERTEAAQDRSWALNHLIEEACPSGDVAEIVGELQFCFLMVLTLNNFSCLEQWKRILSLLFTCRQAVASNSEIFVQAIESLMLQLLHCKVSDSELIDLADECGSLLKDLLVRFRKGLRGLPGIGVQDVEDRLDDLEQYLETEHGWKLGGTFVKTGVLELEDGELVRMDTTAFDEEDETGEYAPQIVDLTPEQARLLRVGGAEDLHHDFGKTTLEEVRSGGAGVRRTASGEHENVEYESGEEETNVEEVEDLDDMDTRY